MLVLGLVSRHSSKMGDDDSDCCRAIDSGLESLLSGRLPSRHAGLALLDHASSPPRQLSYSWLSSHSEWLAHALHVHVPPCSIVALISPRSAEAVAAWLAIWRVGAAYLPLDHDAPSSRLQWALKDAQPAAILIADFTPAWAELARCPRISIDSVSSVSSTSPSPATTTHGGVAYLIYTSGSTGVPKAVLGTRLGLHARCEWNLQRFPFERGEVCAARCAHSFVDSLWETLGALAAGAPILLLPPSVHASAARLLRVLHAWRVTRVVVVPALLEMMLSAVGEGGVEQLTHLRYLHVSGDALPSRLAARARTELAPSCRVLNLYGCSECSADCTFYEVASGGDELCATRLTPLGQPITGALVRLRALDSDGTTSNVAGDAGEILVGGSVVAQGYLGRPELTAARFLEAEQGASSTGGSTTSRWFATGDIGRLDMEDGVLHYLGRLDAQVKINGVRVEAAEVEAAFEEHAGIARAVAVPIVVGGHTGSNGTLHAGGVTRLVVCCEPSLGSSLTAGQGGDGSIRVCADIVVLAAQSVAIASAMTSWAESCLSVAMRPDCVVLLAALPFLASGKIDRQLLRRHAQSMVDTISAERSQQRARHTAHDGTDEGSDLPLASEAATELLCTTLGAILGRAVWAEDHVSEIGCSSADVARLVHTLRVDHGWLLPAEAVIGEGFTLGSVSLHMRHRPRGGTDEEPSEGAGHDDARHAAAAFTPGFWSVGASLRAPAVGKRNRDDTRGCASISWTRGKATCDPAMASNLPPLPTLRSSWKVDLSKCVDASPLLVGHDDGCVTCVIGSHAGALSAIDLASGDVRWRASLPDRLEASCCVVPPPAALIQAVAEETLNGIVLIGSHDEHMHALRLDNGTRLWSRRCRGALKAAAAPFPMPLYSPAVVAVGACFGGSFFAVDSWSGRTLWEGACDGPVYATPLIDEARARVITASLRGTVQSWHAEACGAGLAFEPTWRFATPAAEPIFSSPALAAHGTAIVFGCADGKLYALDADAGACLWTHDTRGAIFCAPCVVPARAASGEVVLVTSDAAGLCGVGTSDGVLRWAHTGDGQLRGHSAPCASADGVVCAAAVDGRLRWYRVEDGRQLLDSQNADPDEWLLGAAVFSSPVLHAGWCVVGCRDDCVHGMRCDVQF